LEWTFKKNFFKSKGYYRRKFLWASMTIGQRNAMVVGERYAGMRMAQMGMSCIVLVCVIRRGMRVVIMRSEKIWSFVLQ
jgi:hypothetical protein